MLIILRHDEALLLIGQLNLRTGHFNSGPGSRVLEVRCQRDERLGQFYVRAPHVHSGLGAECRKISSRDLVTDLTFRGIQIIPDGS